MLHEELLANGLMVITLSRRTRQPRLMRLWDRLMLRSRSIIETINDQCKNVSQIEHSRHRSLTGFMIKVVGGLIAYVSAQEAVFGPVAWGVGTAGHAVKLIPN